MIQNEKESRLSLEEGIVAEFGIRCPQHATKDYLQPDGLCQICKDAQNWNFAVLGALTTYKSALIGEIEEKVEDAIAHGRIWGGIDGMRHILSDLRGGEKEV